MPQLRLLFLITAAMAAQAVIVTVKKDASQWWWLHEYHATGVSGDLCISEAALPASTCGAEDPGLCTLFASGVIDLAHCDRLGNTNASNVSSHSAAQWPAPALCHAPPV